MENYIYYPDIFLPTTIKIVVPEKNTYKNPTNDLEYHFASELLSKYPNYILYHQCLSVNSIKYFPDVTYVDHSSKIYIALEIDEPYSRSGEIIHYREHEKDRTRNQNFQSNGWYVIRFSEYQVQFHIDKCISTIQSLLYCINEDDFEFLTDDRDILNFREYRWNLKKSERYKVEKKRDFYEYDQIDLEVNPLRKELISKSRRDLTNFLIGRYKLEFNEEIEFIYFINDISQKKIHIKNKREMFRLTLSPEKPNKTSLSFTKYPIIDVYKDENEELYNKVEETLINNHRYFHKNDEIQHVDGIYIGFAFKGTMEDYINKSLSWIGFDHINLSQ